MLLSCLLLNNLTDPHISDNLLSSAYLYHHTNVKHNISKVSVILSCTRDNGEKRSSICKTVENLSVLTLKKFHLDVCDTAMSETNQSNMSLPF